MNILNKEDKTNKCTVIDPSDSTTIPPFVDSLPVPPIAKPINQCDCSDSE